jgi:hypothetical protein
MTGESWSGIISMEPSKRMIVGADTSANSIRRPAASEVTPTRHALWSLDMGIFYRLAAFDPETEELMESHTVPVQFVAEVKRIARIPASDDAAGDYPLDAKQARKVAKRLGITAHPESADYFIEPNFSDAETEGR